MEFNGTEIEAVCFTQGRQYGFRHGLNSVTIKYNDGTIKTHDRIAIGLYPFTVNWVNRTWECRKYDSLLFSLFDMLFNRKEWDSKEHYKQVLDVIKNGTRVYKDIS